MLCCRYGMPKKKEQQELSYILTLLTMLMVNQWYTLKPGGYQGGRFLCHMLGIIWLVIHRHLDILPLVSIYWKQNVFGANLLNYIGHQNEWNHLNLQMPNFLDSADIWTQTILLYSIAFWNIFIL